ncbi:unnamed protein product [Rangifer tarandus platyrhynchus]|uniref:Uncharacterized protein n=1 Tax=Rangifer tarandus platyrhynchus TaxID=3082113 RepID=A0AC59YAY1_RANTA
MAPSSRPILPQGSGARFPCPLPPTQCCMSPVCQSTPGSGGNTRPQGRAMEPRAFPAMSCVLCQEARLMDGTRGSQITCCLPLMPGTCLA